MDGEEIHGGEGSTGTRQEYVGITDQDPATPRQGNCQDTESLAKSPNLHGMVVVIHFCDAAVQGPDIHPRTHAVEGEN